MAGCAFIGWGRGCNNGFDQVRKVGRASEWEKFGIGGKVDNMWEKKS